MSKLNILPCLDSAKLAASRRQELDIPRSVAAALGRSAVKAAQEGFYISETGQEVNWRDAVQTARTDKTISYKLTKQFEAGAFQGGAGKFF